MTSYAYDAYGNLTSVSYTEKAHAIEEDYSNYATLGGVGSLRILVDGVEASNRTYSYDNQGNLCRLKDTRGSGADLSYSYDNNNNLTQIAYTNASTGHSDNLLTIGYNAQNQIASETLTGSVNQPLYTANYTFRADGNVVSATTTGTTASGTDTSKTTYTYDVFGRLDTELNKLNNVAQYNNMYTYDNYNNIATERTYSTTPSSYYGSSVLTPGVQYGYDTTTTYTYDAANRLTKQVNKDNHASGSVVSTMTFAYDSAGNLLTKSKDGTAKQTFTYNALNQVASYSDGTLTTSYLYGAQGERIEKSGGNTLTSVWDGGMIVYDIPKLSDTTSARFYVNGAGNNGMVKGAVFTPRIVDRAGSTAATGSGNALTTLNNYDAYGNQKAGANITTATNAYGYDGYYTDSESGLYYLNNRYYDPTTQRFTQQDPIGDGTNWYGYCGGNPVMFSDPTGLTKGDGNPLGDTTPPLYTRVLRNGSKGGDVQIVQTKLNLRGCTDENGHILKENGIFDKHTTTAVKEFQWAAKLSTDGVVGPKTWKSLFGSDVDVGHLLYPDSARKAYGYTTPVKREVKTGNFGNGGGFDGAGASRSWGATTKADLQKQLKADKKALKSAQIQQAGVIAGMGATGILMGACLAVPGAGEVADEELATEESASAATLAEIGCTIAALEQAVSQDGELEDVFNFIESNVAPSFQQNVIEAFGSDAKVVTLTQNTTVYRYVSNSSSSLSPWVTPYQYANPISELALPSSNTAEYMQTYIIPKGTQIIEGTVAQNFNQLGGGYQYYVSDPSILIRIK